MELRPFPRWLLPEPHWVREEVDRVSRKGQKMSAWGEVTRGHCEQRVPGTAGGQGSIFNSLGLLLPQVHGFPPFSALEQGWGGGGGWGGLSVSLQERLGATNSYRDSMFHSPPAGQKQNKKHTLFREDSGLISVAWLGANLMEKLRAKLTLSAQICLPAFPLLLFILIL